MANELRIADDLTLPIDAVTETFLIFGKRGSGKTSTSVVLTEEMIGAGLPVAILDPMGAWWGLRSSADGNGSGLPVTILGGEHADLPLPPESGAAVADLLAAERLPLVLDMFDMSKTQQRTFVTDFMERLFRANRDPLHLVIDEADRFAPQRGSPEGARLLGAYEDIVLRGRKPGIGSTSITLRPAQLHSAIRSQVEVLIAMKLLGKLDVQAIDEWVRLHATEEEARELKASLPSLAVGTGWFWSPGWLEIMAKVHVRARRTFDSSATPKVGEQRIVPREFAPVNPADLERLGTRLRTAPAAEAPGKPTADVKRLSAELARLRVQLAEASQREPERVEVPVLAPGDIAALEQAVTGLRDLAGGIELALSRAVRPPSPSPVPASAPKAAPAPAVARLPRSAPATVSADASLKPGALRVLEALARRHPLRVTRPQLATLAGMKRTGGAFQAYFSALRAAGLIAEAGGLISVTPDGLVTAGLDPGAEPLTAGDLRETWKNTLKPKAWAVLECLLAAYPEARTKAELAQAVAMAVTGGGFQGYLTTLSANDLVSVGSDGVRAADAFFLGTALEAGGGLGA